MWCMYVVYLCVCILCVVYIWARNLVGRHAIGCIYKLKEKSYIFF